MIEYITRHKEIRHVYNQYYGGYVTYLKLWCNLFYNQCSVMKTLDVKQAFEMWGTFIVKSPWWLIIKPFGGVYSYTTRITGDFYYYEDSGTGHKIIDNNRLNVKKKVTHKLFRIPILSHPYAISIEEREKLIW